MGDISDEIDSDLLVQVLRSSLLPRCSAHKPQPDTCLLRKVVIVILTYTVAQGIGELFLTVCRTSPLIYSVTCLFIVNSGFVVLQTFILTHFTKPCNKFRQYCQGSNIWLIMDKLLNACMSLMANPI
uniref:Uncharacterized protein n=1 Tax=Glossina pallidipes TaxID=7398 RepID=A0A1A9ZQV4_GLOPL